MTEQATDPPPKKVRLYTFGTWQQQEAPQGADPTPLGKRVIDYLSGTYKGPLSDREAALLFEEFASQERYRLRLLSELQKCLGNLQKLSQDAISDAPPYRAAGSYNAGMNLGRYLGYCDAAQQVANVINQVSVQTHVDNEKLTEERRARAAEEPKP